MPKPFDLKAALAGKPVLGPDGKPVRRLIHVPERISEWEILVVFYDGRCGWYREDGTTPHDDPLTMADPPKKRVELWMNVYKNDTIVGYRSSGHLYKSDEEARKSAEHQCDVIAQAFVTFYVEDEA